MQINAQLYFSIIPEWLTISEISDNAFRVYSVLCRYADKIDGSCWPSIKTIGQKCGKSPSTVKRGLKELEKIGAIVIDPRYNDDGQTSNLYTIIYNPAFKNERKGGIKYEQGGVSNTDYKPKSSNQSQKNERYKIYSALSIALDYEPKTKTEISGFNKVVKDIYTAGGTPDEVADRVKIYKTKWKDITLTPFAISKNWTLLGQMVDENKPQKVHDCAIDGHKWRDTGYVGQYRLFLCLYCGKEKQENLE
jgi:hypothetical protein